MVDLGEISPPPEAAAPASSDPPPPPADKDAALRVAYIVRSYLSLRQAGAQATSPSAKPPPPAADAPAAERCRAMMEVVKKEGGGGAKWRVSKLVVEHNHELSVAPGEERGAAVPVLGMEFDSVEAAKGFYYGYGEKLGFKPRTGSNRRSVGNGALIMQRFLCWRGNYMNRRSKGAKEAKKEVKESVTAKRKRGPYKKRGRKPGKKSVEVIEVESSEEKVAAVTGKENGKEVKSRRASRRGSVVGRRKKGSTEKDGDWIIGLEAAAAEEEVEGDGEEEEEEGEKEEEVGAKGKGRWRGKGKAGAASNSAQSRVLRELGVRVSRYNNEERRKILNKYLSKRQSRPVPGRPAKIASRQALAERRIRGNGGRFLAREGPPPSRPPSERRSKRIEKQNLKREEAKAASKEDEIIEAEPDPPTEIVAGPGGEPKIGMVFLNEDKAYEFYVNYAGTAGFSVRKGWWDKTAKNVTKSRAYVCSKEGFRPKSATTESKKPRPETRTGCQAHMSIKITTSGKYAVTEYVADHNHDLEAPLVDIQILRSQKLLAKVQQPPEPPKVVLIPSDYKNYLRSKRTKDIQLGDAGAICEYLQRMKGDNPSFFCAIQVDEDDQLTNIFWADVKSMMDYQYFGDVVCFDTRYSTSDYGRPLAVFIGVNHHKQPIIFGTALVYDESVESFRWLFETFKSAMSGKPPKTVLTDHSTAISDAIAAAWPGTTHRLSTLHLYQNATKILSNIFEESETFAHDFSRWLYDCEEEDDFLSTWEMILEKYNLKDNDWLGKLYEDRERWALPYGRDTFCADITGTLRNDNMDTFLTELLKTEIELPYFFNNYDKFVEDKRLAEQQADYLGTQMTQRVAPLRLLWQAANAYTPAVFEMFRLEFDLFLTCIVYSCGEIGPISEYEVTVKDKPRGHFVRFDSSECMVVCTCKKFEFVGIPCCHVLKILDIRNIKELPPHYILKRWRKDAQNDSLRENNGFAFDDDPKFSLSKRYSSLCRILYKLAARAAENVEAYAFMESQSDQLLEQVEHILQARLHDKSSLSATPKGHQHNLLQNEASNSDSRRPSGKKNKNAESRRRHQSPLESNKRKKGRQGLPEPEETEVPLRVEPPPVSNDIPNHLRTPPNQFLAPSQLMQAPYVPAQQFGLGSLQGFHGMSPFAQMQESSAAPLQQPTLQQQPFHSGAQIPQAPPPDIQSLQFLGSNPQLGHQSTDQGQYTIPVWDFL